MGRHGTIFDHFYCTQMKMSVPRFSNGRKGNSFSIEPHGMMRRNIWDFQVIPLKYMASHTSMTMWIVVWLFMHVVWDINALHCMDLDRVLFDGCVGLDPLDVLRWLGRCSGLFIMRAYVELLEEGYRCMRIAYFISFVSLTMGYMTCFISFVSSGIVGCQSVGLSYIIIAFKQAIMFVIGWSIPPLCSSSSSIEILGKGNVEMRSYHQYDIYQKVMNR
eukprot:185907_1